jgi:prepilin-type N-terminal cleavage/methylation domain-containing protein
MRKLGGERGDTLIEVLVAMAVLGALVTIAYTVMNRGYATAQNSLDSTASQAITSGQASMLRAIHARAMRGEDSNGYWDSVVARTVVETNTTLLDKTKLASGCETSLRAEHNRLFYFDPASTDPFIPKQYLTSPTDVNKLPRRDSAPGLGQEKGIWIEGYSEPAGASGVTYVFYIKACWEPSFGDGVAVKREAKTVVRLYVPAN